MTAFPGIGGVKKRTLAFAFSAAMLWPAGGIPRMHDAPESDAAARRDAPEQAGPYLEVTHSVTGMTEPVYGPVHIRGQSLTYSEYPTGIPRAPAVADRSYVRIHSSNGQAVQVRCASQCPSYDRHSCFAGRAVDSVLVTGERAGRARSMRLEFHNADTLQPDFIQIGPDSLCSIYLGDRDWQPPRP